MTNTVSESSTKSGMPATASLTVTSLTVFGRFSAHWALHLCWVLLGYDMIREGGKGSHSIIGILDRFYSFKFVKLMTMNAAICVYETTRDSHIRRHHMSGRADPVRAVLGLVGNGSVDDWNMQRKISYQICAGLAYGLGL